MNRIYRTVFNASQGQPQVVCQAVGSGQRGASVSSQPRSWRRTGLRLQLSVLALAIAAGLSSSYVWAAPGDGGNSGNGRGGDSGEGGDTTFNSGGNASGSNGNGGNGATGGMTGVGGAGGAPATLGTFPGGAGGNGGDWTSPGGGGGGGAGLFLNGLSLSLANSTVQGGNGGNGGSGTTGGGGGGGGNGVTLSDGQTLNNQGGTIMGGNGGNGGAGAAISASGSGGGGGHGISGSNLTITNAATISAGSGGTGGGNGGLNGSDGAAVQFTAGTNALILQSGSVINGVIWLMDGSSATIRSDAASSLDDGILLGTGTSLTLNAQQNLSVAGITGSGSLSKTGSNTLTLSGSNTYTGATTISAGPVRAGAANTLSSASAFTLASGTTLDLAGFNQSIASLAGSGTVTLGAGTLSTGSNNTSTTFTGAITGSGGLNKTGSGTLTLNNGASSITGGTQVLGGSLIIAGVAGNSGSLASDVDVASGALLGGHGSIIGNVDLASGATLAPGNSIGTLHVTGDVTFNSGSTLEIEANPDGSADRLTATGTVDLGNAALNVLAGTGSWSPSTSYNIVQAGVLNGTFASVNSNLAFLTPTLAYSATGVNLSLVRNDIRFVSVAATPNQFAVSAALEAASGGSLAVAVTGLSAEQARAAFDSLSGELHASTRSVLFDDSRYVREAISQRLSGAQNDSVLHRDGQSGLTFWLQGYGNSHDKDGNRNVADLDSNTHGSFIGADLPLNDNWRVGLLAGYGRNDLDVSQRDSSADIDSTTLAAYLAGQWEALNLRLGAARSWSQVDSKRQAQVGALRNTLKADYDADISQVFAELGYRLPFATVALEPFAGLAHVELDSDSFHEHGGLAALSAEQQDDSISYSTLGLRAAAPLGQVAGLPLSLHSSLAWQHAFDRPANDSQLGLVGYQHFSVEGAPVAQDSALVQVGLDLQLAPQANLQLGYAGNFGDDNRENGLRLGLHVTF
jgi:outer membrane autotransporter protein